MKDWMGITNVSLCSAKLWIGKLDMTLGMTPALILACRITRRVNNIIGQNTASPADDRFPIINLSFYRYIVFINRINIIISIYYKSKSKSRTHLSKYNSME